jgi:hypothetical protein
MNQNDDTMLRLLTVIGVLIEHNDGELRLTEDEMTKQMQRIMSGEMQGIVAERNADGAVRVREASEKDQKLALAAMIREMAGLPPREADEAQEKPVEEPVLQEFTSEDEKAPRGMGFKL